MSVACVWSVCAPVWLILATPSRRSISPLNGPTPDATPLWDDVILRGLVRPAPRTDPRRNTPCGGDVILRGPCRSDSSRASPSKPSQTSHFPWAGAQLIQWRRLRARRGLFSSRLVTLISADRSHIGGLFSHRRVVCSRRWIILSVFSFRRVPAQAVSSGCDPISR